MRMPFGKYRGQPLSAIPGDYLAWLLTIELWPATRQAVADELRRRGYSDAGQPQPEQSAEQLRSIVEHWYRAAALRFHPDRGGQPRDMVILNECKELLLAKLKQSHKGGYRDDY